MGFSQAESVYCFSELFLERISLVWVHSLVYKDQNTGTESSQTGSTGGDQFQGREEPEKSVFPHVWVLKLQGRRISDTGM